MKKNMLYFIEKSSIETGDFSRVYIPKDNNPYKVLNGKPFILNSKKSRRWRIRLFKRMRY